MNDLQDLYQEVIIDHNNNPRNCRILKDANYVKEGYNPLCGDRLTLYIKEKNGVIEEVCFQGSGCAIFIASTSMMTEVVKGKTIAEFKCLHQAFHLLVTSGDISCLPENADKLKVFSKVSEFPMRVKCATLPWHTLKVALFEEEKVISSKSASTE